MLLILIIFWTTYACGTDETITARLSKTNNICERRIVELCKESLCPSYCTYSYKKNDPTDEVMLRECFIRCKTDLCTIKSTPDPFNAPLDGQLRDQLVVCMNDLPKEKDKDGEDHAWVKFRTKDFANLEKQLKAREENLEKQKKQDAATKKIAPPPLKEPEENNYCGVSRKKLEEITSKTVKTETSSPAKTESPSSFVMGIVETSKRKISVDSVPTHTPE